MKHRNVTNKTVFPLISISMCLNDPNPMYFLPFIPPPGSIWCLLSPTPPLLYGVSQKLTKKQISLNISNLYEGGFFRVF